jgi:hypothetical protein
VEALNIWSLNTAKSMNKSMNKLSVLIICILIPSITIAIAQAADLTGTWTSRYQFGPIEEVMTAEIQHLGDDLLGSFSVKPSSGDEYSGVIFGRVEGKRVIANYLSVRDLGAADPQVTIILIDSQISDKDTLKGTYYVQDSQMNAISGPFEATRE